jgi:hypothetical protein
MMQCVQEDPSNPQPCTPADMAKYPGGQLPAAPTPAGGAKGEAPSPDQDNPDELPDAGCNPDFEDCSDAAHH